MSRIIWVQVAPGKWLPKKYVGAHWVSIHGDRAYIRRRSEGHFRARASQMDPTPALGRRRSQTVYPRTDLPITRRRLVALSR